MVEDASAGEISYTPANADVFADQQVNIAQVKIVIGGKDDYSDHFLIDVGEAL